MGASEWSRSFFLGGGLSLYHGISGILSPHEVGDPTMALYILGASLIFDGGMFQCMNNVKGTMIVAYNQIAKSAKVAGVSFRDYLKRGGDPTAVQVFLEDCASVAGVIIAATSLSLSKVWALPILDSMGSVAIGVLLGAVASFLVKRNIASLVETSLSASRQAQIVSILEKDPVVKSVHDVKTTCLGPEWVRFKGN
jgi:zinc transporter 9